MSKRLRTAVASLLVVSASWLLGASCQDCAAEDGCVVIRDDDGDGKVATEIQRAWNDFVLANQVTTPRLRMAAHEGRWRIDRQVRLCWAAAPPPDGPGGEPGVPTCTEPSQLASLKFENDWEVRCNIGTAPREEIGDSGFDACIRVGSGAAQAVLDPATGPRVTGTLDIDVRDEVGGAVALTPFYCDGCGEYAFTFRSSIAPGNFITWTFGGGIFVGGSGTIHSGPTSDGTLAPYVRLQGPHGPIQVGGETVPGTLLDGQLGQLHVPDCDYMGVEYDCDVTLPDTSTVDNEVVWGDGGSLTSDAVISSLNGEPAIWMDFRGTDPGEVFGGSFDIGGTLHNPIVFHPCIRLSDDLVRPVQPVTFRGRCENQPPDPSQNDQGIAECQQLDPAKMGLTQFHLTQGAVLSQKHAYQHMLSREMNCRVTTDGDVELAAAFSGDAPEAPAGPWTGNVTSATNGAGYTTPPTVDVGVAPAGVQVGDRFRFTEGPFAWEDRLVIGVAGSTLTLSGPFFFKAGGPIEDLQGLAYEIWRPLCLSAPGAWAACGGAETRLHVASASETASEGRVTVAVAPGADVSCHLTWVRNGVDQLGYEYTGNKLPSRLPYPKENPSWNLGGGVAPVLADPGDQTANGNFFSPLRAAGDEEIRTLTDGLEPGDYVELQLSPGPAGTCAQGTGCGCFGDGQTTRSLGSGTASLTTFADALDPPSP